MKATRNMFVKDETGETVPAFEDTKRHTSDNKYELLLEAVSLALSDFECEGIELNHDTVTALRLAITENGIQSKGQIMKLTKEQLQELKDISTDVLSVAREQAPHPGAMNPDLTGPVIRLDRIIEELEYA